LDLDVINERLNTVGTFVKSENDEALNLLVKYLKSIGNMRVTMIKLRKGVGGGSTETGGFSKSVWTNLQKVSVLPMRTHMIS
jgi:DNA mismatch repair protein MSH5